jgi:hypothetical protein
MKFKILPWLCILTLLALPIVVFAQDAGTLPDITSVFAAFVLAIKNGQWPVAAVLILVAVTWGLRTFGGKFIPWLTTSEGGTVLAFLTALAATLGAAAMAGQNITWGLVGAAFGVGFTAIGAWTGVRRLLRAFVPLAMKVAPWLGNALAWLSGAETEAPPAT